jgi:hypothetical protein
VLAVLSIAAVLIPSAEISITPAIKQRSSYRVQKSPSPQQ